MRTFLLFIATLIFIPSFHAQEQWQIGVFGATGAGFIARQNNFGGPELDYDYSLSPGFGISFQRNFKNAHLIGLEIAFAQTRTIYSEKIGQKLWGRNIKTSYIQFPLYYQGILGNAEPKGVKGTYSLGMYAGILRVVRSTYFIDNAEVDFQTYLESDPRNPYLENIIYPATDKDLFENIDLGLLVGLGLKIYINSRLIIQPEIRISGSIRDINHENYRELKNRDGELKDSRNLWAQIRLGLAYRF